MLKNISRVLLSALLPPGSAWEIKEDGDFDLLLDGISENYEEIREFLRTLRYAREPQLTTILSDLEREFGLTPNTALTEQERRDRLDAAKYLKNSDGSQAQLQARLQAAGFNVLVHINDPPVDPGQFVNNPYNTICGNAGAICGASGVVCGTANSNKLLVNGDLIFHGDPFWLTVSGNAGAICGASGVVCGEFIPTPDINQVTYELPPTSDYDHLVFFVGGQATRDSVTGEILAIIPAQIQASRRSEFESIILDYKPMHSWAGLIVEYTL